MENFWCRIRESWGRGDSDDPGDQSWKNSEQEENHLSFAEDKCLNAFPCPAGGAPDLTDWSPLWPRVNPHMPVPAACHPLPPRSCVKHLPAPQKPESLACVALRARPTISRPPHNIHAHQFLLLSAYSRGKTHFNQNYITLCVTCGWEYGGLSALLASFLSVSIYYLCEHRIN